MKFLIFSLTFLLTQVSIANTAPAKYVLDAKHSNVGFKVSHLVVSNVVGSFKDFSGNFEFDAKTGQISNLEAKIDIDTINTNEADRDAHLKNEDFFAVRTKDGKVNEAKRYIVFKSTKVDVKNSKPNKIHGSLTINGVTKPVVLDVNYKGQIKDPWGNTKVGFEATTKINRKDFGLTYNKTLDQGGLMIGEEVKISIDGEAKQL